MTDEPDRPPEQPPHRFRITYQVKHHPDGILATDVPVMHGACDAIAVLQQLYPADGTYSQITDAMEGRGPGPSSLAPDDLWLAWMFLAQALATEDNGLDSSRKLCCWTAYSLASRMVYGQTPEPPPSLQKELANISKLGGLVGYRVESASRDRGNPLDDHRIDVEMPGDGPPISLFGPGAGEVAVVMETRKAFAEDYAKRQGWGPLEGLSVEQIMEIRSQPEWARARENMDKA